MSDLISRQAAIDTIDALHGMPNAWLDCAVDAVMKLPSAQPEIIRCKDCRYFEYNKKYVIQGVPVLGHEVCNAWGDGCKTDENGFCFLAKRRTDDDIR